MVEQVEYGLTGILVSRLCIGTGQFGPGRFNLSVEQGARLLRHAFDKGVTFWDTAPSYGSHRHVRAALDGLRRESVVINSKTRALDRTEAAADLEASLRELGLGYVDTMLLHGVKSPEDFDFRRGALDALLEARDRGLIRAVGVSTHVYTGEIMNVLGEYDDVEVVLSLYNRDGLGLRGGTIESHRRLLAALHDAGKGITGMKVVGDGALADQAVDSIRDALAAPFLTSVCIGVCNQEQIDLAVTLAGGGRPSADLTRLAGATPPKPWAAAFGRY